MISIVHELLIAVVSWYKNSLYVHGQQLRLNKETVSLLIHLLHYMQH